MHQKFDRIHFKMLAGMMTLVLVPLVLSSCATWQKAYDLVRPSPPWYKTYGFDSKDDVLSIGSLPTLIDALGDRKSQVRVKAARALAEIGPDARDAVPALTEVAENDKDFVRQAAADALEAIVLELELMFDEDEKERNKIKLLVNTVRLESKDWLIKREAVNQLADMGKDAASAVPVLIRVLEDRSDWHRHYDEILKGAVTVLGNIGPEAEAANPALIKMLENKDFDVRLEVVKAMGKIGPKSDSAVIEALTRALHGDPEFIQARHMFARLLPTRFEYLAYKGILYGDPDCDVRREAAASLGKFEAHAISAVPALLDSALTDIDYNVRRQSALSLCRIEPGGDSAMIALDKAIDDPEGPLTREVAMMELQHARSEIRDAWLPKIIYRLDDIEESVRLSAVRILAEYNIGNEMVLKALNRVALEDKSFRVKNEALKTLLYLKSDSSPE